MQPGQKPLQDLIREFFGYYPDYVFCRTLALNVQENVTTYPEALNVLVRKAGAAEQNREEIHEKLNRRTTAIDGKLVRIRDLSLREIMKQNDGVLKEILEFYFKHPYAHGRTRKSRFLPRWIRTIFLSALVGHAKRRGVDLEYDEYFELLRLL